MGNISYLSEEEQFKEILNNEEISRIKDPEIRNIRSKYWNLRHQAFLNEHNIPDSMLGQELDKINAAETKELDEYTYRHNKN